MRVYSTPPIEEEDADYIEPPVGIPGGRAAGAPLDLSTLSEPGAPDPRGLPPDGSGPPPSVGMGGGYPPISRNPAAPAQTAVLAPSATPRDEYDLAYGYMLRKDYALAEESFRSFLQKYPNDQRAAEAGYWLGESLFQRQRYRDAAENFLTVSTKFDKSAKAPEAMVRLAQSLAALKEKEAACATFGEVGRKFPRATAGVKQAVEREQKRVRC
jgi:tol-pal system protein YbgF